MRLVFIIDDILQIDSRQRFEILKELLIVYISDAANLIDGRLFARFPITKIRRNRQRQFSAKFLSRKSRQNVATSVGADDNVEVELGESPRPLGVTLRRIEFELGRPALFGRRGRRVGYEFGARVDFDAEEKREFEENQL